MATTLWFSGIPVTSTERSEVLRLTTICNGPLSPGVKRKSSGLNEITPVEYVLQRESSVTIRRSPKLMTATKRLDGHAENFNGSCGWWFVNQFKRTGNIDADPDLRQCGPNRPSEGPDALRSSLPARPLEYQLSISYTKSLVQRDSVRDQIKRLLLARILDGTYQPGDRLLELPIAHELNVSQGPVREALRELEALRLVESKTYRGTRVRGVNAREMREAYQVRAVLEEMASHLAGDAFKGNAAALRTEVNALRKAAKARDPEAYASHNLKLHRLIVEASGNAVLLRLWE